MNKASLREIYRKKRKEIDARERLRMDDLMLIQFQRLYLEDIDVVMTYWPLQQHAEPNMHLYNGYLRHMLPGIEFAYPVSNRSDHTIQAVLINEDTIYNTNEWGITEPTSGDTIQAADIDLIFVPLLVCDERGFRVGYGKGYYDRFLANCRENVITIGFSYFEPVALIADTHEFDVPLTYCITPKDIYEF